MRVVLAEKSYSLFTESVAHYLDREPVEIQSMLPQTIIAPFWVELPHEIQKQAARFLQNLSQVIGTEHFGGFSACLDFHWDQIHQKLYLIEANTNAAFLALSTFLYPAQGCPSPLKIEEIYPWFLEFTNQEKNLPIFITDDDVPLQPLRIEFQVYEKLFLRSGRKAYVIEASEITATPQVIYNRTTDFFLRQEKHLQLKTFFQKFPHLITPNPRDYQKFAHKILLVDWSLHEKLKTFVPKTQILTAENADTLWIEKKHWFFKPIDSFASKATYRGANISRPHFQSLITTPPKFIAQNFIPASELETPFGKQKFDIRFYISGNQIRQALTRFYQGQVTTLRSPHGGFASIRWV